jgi:hypothetical protein
MNRRFFRRCVAASVLTLALLGSVLLPRIALACDSSWNPVEAAACSMDVAQYNAYVWVAEVIYLLLQVLLVACYWVDVIRVWLMETVFLTVYQYLLTTLGPLFVPIVLVALFVGLLAIVLLPITESKGPINLKTVLLWGIIGPSVLVFVGPTVVEFDKQRASIGATLFNSVTVGRFSVGGAGPTDAFRVVPIYPSGDCPFPLSRYTLPSPPAAPTVDEQVAALILADAADLHCPTLDGPDGAERLPDAWFALNVADRGYARLGGIDSLDKPADRAAWIGKIQEGIGVLALALTPAFAALVLKLLDLLFTLCTFCLALGFPLGVLAGLFQRSQAWLGAYVQRGARILVLSLVISLVYGVLVALLGDAAASGNVIAYVAIVGIVALFLIKWFFTVFGLLGEAVDAVMVACGGGANTGPTPGQLLGGAVTAGAAMATGGASLAAAGVAGYAQTGSTRYALGAMAGRTPLMALGSVAHALGAVGDETAVGLQAGHATTRSPRGWSQLAHARDHTITDTDGDRRTIGEAVQNRRIIRQSQGNVVQRNIREVRDALSGTAAGAARAVAAPHRVAMAVGDAVVDGAAQVATGVAQGQAAGGPVGAVAGGLKAGADVLHLTPVDGQAMQLVNGRVQHQPRVAQPPPDARSARLSPGQLADKLRQGYVVQRDSDGRVTWWPVATPAGMPPPSGTPPPGTPPPSGGVPPPPTGTQP